MPSDALSAPLALRPQARPVTGPSRVIAALVLREMVTTYGRSPGGWLWALVEPVAAIALLSFAFSLIFRDPPLGRDFALFYATGFLPYMMFHDISAKVAAAVRFSRPLLSFGRVTFLDAILARIALNAFTHVLIVIVVMAALLAVTPTDVDLSVAGAALALGMALALAVGVGLVNCHLFTAFPAWERLWAIGMRPLFIVSGVVFLLEDVPGDYRGFLLANPLFHVTGTMREAVYPAYAPDYPSLIFVFGISAILSLVGIALLRLFHDELIHK